MKRFNINTVMLITQYVYRTYLYYLTVIATLKLPFLYVLVLSYYQFLLVVETKSDIWYILRANTICFSDSSIYETNNNL